VVIPPYTARDPMGRLSSHRLGRWLYPLGMLANAALALVY
jgi:hypothetical protein